MTTPPAYQDPAYSVLPQAPVPQPPKKGARALKKLLIRLGIGLIALVIWMIYDEVTGDPSTANAGDCVQVSGTDDNPDVHVIDCKDPKAAYKVLREDTGNGDQCKSVPGVVAWYTETGRANVVLCLGKNQ
ncbi:hypothetical protein FNV62_05955 [Streptomyces sp. RLB3-17]|uniref:LppU/SCO3897 family protein n=1 Tax=Streptomyces sp. RLB3-17 TaxID=2594455 RepID=UPI00116294D3|nr:hypothetical protein [Streptomyces sp. RLB3-17]QDO37791.1 hypothetical protein FNV62_05955 [Streptomyces sp. RLB3-17]